MVIGTYSDGRQLNYDESRQAFDIGGAAVTPEQVAAFDAAAQIEWTSAETKEWFIRALPGWMKEPVAPTQGKKPWFKRRWVWAVGLLILAAAIGIGGQDESSTDPGVDQATAEASAESEVTPAASEPSAPKLKPLGLTVTAPEAVEGEAAEITGKTLPGAAVTVGGEPVAVDGDGAFILPVTLATGDNTYEVVATLDGHTEASRSVVIVRKVYAPLSARDFALVAKDPDAHAGETYIIYGEVIQFDSATGLDHFRANTGGVKSAIEYGWMTDYDQNSMLTGDTDMLADVVQGDCFEAKVTVDGSYSYDTQIGGNTTVPMFTVDAISVYGTVTE